MSRRSDARPEPPVAGVDDRTLPNNLDAERSVLGAILVHNDAYEHASAVIRADDFYRDAHRRIFAAIAYLVEDRRVVADFVTLKEELIARREIDEVGGAGFIASLADGVPRATNVEYYAGIVRDKAVLRRLIYAGNKMVIDAYAAEEETDTILHRADLALLDVINAHASSRMSSLGADHLALFADFEHRVEHRGELTGIETGFPTLNDLTSGWQRGDLIVIAARPSEGKTSLVMNSVTAAARKGAHCAVFSLEMRKRQMQYRMMSSLSGVPASRLLGGYVGSLDYGKVSHAFEELASLPIQIDDRGRQTAQDIRSSCRRLKSEGPLDLVVVDYMQLMTGALTQKGATRNDELGDASRRLKVLADELSVPIIVLSQLRRLNGRHVPVLEDLRDSGALEQDADIVGFIHGGNHRTSGLKELILAKQRNGATGTVRLKFTRDILKFEDAGPQPEEEEAQPEQPPLPEAGGGRRRRHQRQGDEPGELRY